MGNRYLVVQLLDKKKADLQDPKKRDETLKRLLEEKQEMVWSGWMEQQRQKTSIKMLNQI
jgi:parvulin-like peptidyl-prolyl isomerase